jgi:hypothetical protein
MAIRKLWASAAATPGTAALISILNSSRAGVGVRAFAGSGIVWISSSRAVTFRSPVVNNYKRFITSNMIP